MRYLNSLSKKDGAYELAHNDINFFQQQMSAIFRPCDRLLDKVDQIMKTSELKRQGSVREELEQYEQKVRNSQF